VSFALYPAHRRNCASPKLAAPESLGTWNLLPIGLAAGNDPGGFEIASAAGRHGPSARSKVRFLPWRRARQTQKISAAELLRPAPNALRSAIAIFPIDCQGSADPAFCGEQRTENWSAPAKCRSRKHPLVNWNAPTPSRSSLTPPAAGAFESCAALLRGPDNHSQRIYVRCPASTTAPDMVRTSGPPDSLPSDESIIQRRCGNPKLQMSPCARAEHGSLRRALMVPA